MESGEARLIAPPQPATVSTPLSRSHHLLWNPCPRQIEKALAMRWRMRRGLERSCKADEKVLERIVKKNTYNKV